MKLGLTLVLLLVPVIILTAFLVQNPTRLSNQAAELKTVNLILELSKDPTTGIITVDKAQSNNGFSPKTPATVTSETLEQVQNGQVVGTTNVQFVSETFGDYLDPETNTPKFGGEFFNKPKAIVSFQYKPGSTLRIKTSATKSQELKSPKINLALANTKRLDLSPAAKTTLGTGQKAIPSSNPSATSQDGYIDLLFMSDHYNEDFGRFDADVDTMVSHLLQKQPFADYAGKIRITKLHTGYYLCPVPYWEPMPNGRYKVNCNENAIFNIASQVPYDYIVVVENTNDHHAYGYYGSYVVMAASYYNENGNNSGRILAHELGHTIGWLKDEYSFDQLSSEEGDDASWYVNCTGVSSCHKWSGVTGTSCINTCSYTDWFRPTENSMMNNEYTNPEPPYGPVNEPYLRGYLNSLAPIEPGSPIPGDSNYVWTTNWCVYGLATCTESGLQKPTAYFDNDYCSDGTNNMICSGYQYKDSPPPTTTPTPAPTQYPITVRVVNQATSQKFPTPLTIRSTYMSSCQSGCNASCSDPVCTLGREKSYDPNGCNGTGCAAWENSTDQSNYSFIPTNLPTSWQVFSNGCSNWTPTISNSRTCTILVQPITTPVPTTAIQGSVFFDKNNNAIRNPVEQGIGEISLPLFRVINGNSTLVTRVVSTSTQGNNFSFANMPAGKYQFGSPKNLGLMTVINCSDIKPPKPSGIPKDRHFFYCKALNSKGNKYKLILKKWTPNKSTAFKDGNKSFDHLGSENTFVDIPLVTKPAAGLNIEFE